VNLPTFGENIFLRSLEAYRYTDKFGNVWQYHSRSDQHSKLICWAILFDLLNNCTLLLEHVHQNKIHIGVNHRMKDFKSLREKDLDLVLSTPGGAGEKIGLHELAEKWNLVLTHEERSLVNTLPSLSKGPAGTALIALEAKACMTEHAKARPRLFDELASSFQTIHGDTNNAIAAGCVVINTSDQFVSPLRNKHSFKDKPFEVTHMKQPKAAIGVYEKVKELPRRSKIEETGFDAFGVMLISLANNQSPITSSSRFTEDLPLDPKVTYASLIERISSLYAARFSSI
jgi:hypothetical protein